MREHTQEAEKIVNVANSITYGDLAIIALLIIVVVCLLAIVSNTGQTVTKVD